MRIETRYLEIKVKPNAKVSLLCRSDTGEWMAQLKSAPVDGKANAELIRLVAKQFGCQRSAVTIKSGGSGRVKLVSIAGPTNAQ